MAYNGTNAKFPKGIKGVLQNDLYHTYDEIGNAYPPPPGDYWLQQNGDYWLQQNGDAWIIIT